MPVNIQLILETPDCRLSINILCGTTEKKKKKHFSLKNSFEQLYSYSKVISSLLWILFISLILSFSSLYFMRFCQSFFLFFFFFNCVVIVVAMSTIPMLDPCFPGPLWAVPSRVRSASCVSSVCSETRLLLVVLSAVTYTKSPIVSGALYTNYSEIRFLTPSSGSVCTVSFSCDLSFLEEQRKKEIWVNNKQIII